MESLGDRQLRMIFDSAMDAMLLVDDQGNCIEINPVACELFGTPRDQLLQQSLDCLMTPESNFRMLWQRLPAQGQHRGTLQIIREDGCRRDVNYVATAHFAPHQHLLVLRDVTKVKPLAQQQEMAPHAIQKKYQTLFEILPIGVSITDEQGKLIEVNPASETILGISSEEHTQRTCDESTWKILRPDGSPMPTEEYASVRALREQRVFTHQEQGIVRPDGSIAWIVVSAAPIPLAGYGVAIVYADISERKHLELQLQAANDRYNLVMHSIGEGIWEWDCIANVLTGSPRFWAILGESVPTQPLSIELLLKRVHPDDHALLEAAMHPHLQTRSPYGTEIRMRHRAGHDVWIRSRGHAIWDAQGNPLRMVGTIEDISDRKAHELALARQAQRERTFSEVSNAIRSSLNLDTIFSVAVGEIAEFLQGEVSIVKYLPEVTCWRHLVTYSRGNGYTNSLNADVPDTDNPLAARLKQLQIVQIDDTSNLDDPINRHLADLFPGAWLLVPISVNDAIWGSLTLARPYQTQPWHPEEIDLAQRVADQLAIAIQQANLYHRLESSEEKLSRVLENVNASISSLRLFTNLDWEYDYISSGCETLFGYSADALQQDKYFWRSRVHPEDRDRLIQHITDITSKSSINTLEYRFFHRDSRIRWISETFSSHWNEAEQCWIITIVSTDVSDRKQMETELRRREQEFRTLAENTPDCIMRCDRQFRFLYVNPPVTVLSRIPAPAFLGKTAQEIGFPDTLTDLWHQAMEQVFVTGYEQSIEYDIALAIGTRTFYSRVVPEFAFDGSVGSVLVVARDISDLKQAQQELLLQAEREQLLNIVTQHIRESLELDQVLTTAVNEAQQMLQVDRMLVYRVQPNGTGKVIAEAVLPGWPVILERIFPAETFPRENYDRYVRGRIYALTDRATGEILPCLVNFLAEIKVQAKLVVPIIQNDTLWGLLIAHQCSHPRQWQPWEIDLVKQLADQLAIAIQQSELYYQVQNWAATLEKQVQERTATIQQALDFEATLKRITDRVRDSLDEDQILETAVNALGEVLGLECCDTGIYNPEQTTSTIAHEFTRSLPSAKGITFDIATATHSEIYPFLLMGEVLQFCDRIPCSLRNAAAQLTVMACPIMDDQRVLGDMWLCKAAEQIFTPQEVRLVQQVTTQCAIALRQARLFEASKAQVNELARLNSLKDDFLSTVSHELRTPMASVKMATDLLELQLKQLQLLPQTFNDNTSGTSNNLVRYFQILKTEGMREINLINDLLDLTRLDAHSEPLNLSTIQLQDWIPHLLEPFVTRTQQQHQHLTSHLPDDLPPITTDLSYVQRIINELLNNACKYTPPGETISLTVQANADEFELAIANTGVEIPKAEQARIFERFYRIPNSDPWKHGGTGLGLALVKKLVEYLSGSIQLKSESQVIQFIIHLPQCNIS